MTAALTHQRTGGEALVDSLIAHGVDTVFGLPGAQTYGLFDALHGAQPGVRTVGARHEQACSYMAFGYARSTGRPGVCTVVPGPGILNAGAGLLTAWGCNQPVLCLTGQVPKAFLDQGRGHLHEMADQLGTVAGFTKSVARIEHPALAPGLVAAAFKQMRQGRPGPAVLEMPWDVFTQRAAVAPVAPYTGPLAPPPDTEVAESAARLIAASRFPMIFVGGGAQDAAESIGELAQMLDAPVVGFRSGRGVVSDADELGLNIAAAWRLWPKTDLLIGIGTRLEVPGWRWPWRPTGQKTIRLDIDPAEMRRAPPDIALIADADAGTRALLTALRQQPVQRGARREAIRAARAAAEADIQSIQPQVAYLRAIREVLPEQGMVTDEISQMGFTSWYAFPVYRPRTFISSGYQGTLGSGFPTALGVKVAHPDRPVVAICGDGGFMFAVQELATAVQYGIGVVTLVFNNNAFGNVRRDQRERFGGRVLGADLHNPDFLKLADAFGVRSERVASPDALQSVLSRALDSGAPWLIEVPVPRDAESDPWRFLQPQAP
ncbi:MAG TPA: thiamine pyrophosphate-dependent enzyme [Steroidobacteraceae bacterium]|jgi:acetolactate synthase-1/2/3 large subunit